MLSIRRFPVLLYVGLLSIASLSVHLVPFIFFSNNPLGYDTGFYRRYLIEPFLSFPNTPVPGLGNDALGPRILLDILHFAHVPTDLALYCSYLVLYTLLPILVFFFLRRIWGAQAAFLAGMFVLLSSVAYQAYWYMLFKNIFSLDLMIAAFLAIERRYMRTAYALDIALAVSHTTSAVVYMLTLIAHCIFEPARRREMLIHLSLVAVPFVMVNTSHLHGASVAFPTALFVEWSQFFWLSLPYLLLLVAVWRLLWSQPIPRTLLMFTGVSILYPILHLPFFERIFVYADVGLAMLSAYAAFTLVKHFGKIGLHGYDYARAAIMCISLGLLLGNLYNQVYSLRPLMTDDSISRIETIGLLVPAHAYLLTSANEAPWYEGWTTSHIIAPGLLHDTHNLEEWQALWSATSTAYRIQFLNSFKTPLYVGTLAPFPDLIGQVPPCLTKIAPELLYSSCDR